MRPSAEFFFDVTAAQHQGRRESQEDAVVADFPLGAGMGFAVLADGMGGHAAGDVASNIVVTEVFSELKMRAGDPGALETSIAEVLYDAVHAANECVRYHADNNPDTSGMGTTLVAPVLMGSNLYWISVGDSPLYLFRDGELIRLNQDHSMVAHMDYLVATGAMAWEVAENHPDRNCLTSVLIGDSIPQIDCPSIPVRLKLNDIVLVASDGLQFLADEEIAELVQAQIDGSSAAIGAALLQSLDDLDDPDQDNITLCVIKVTAGPRAAAEAVDEIAPATAACAALADARKRSAVTFVATASQSGHGITYRVSMEKTA